jgi:leader peptidase (prepilin peptidase)/N-methyltransferase
VSLFGALLGGAIGSFVVTLVLRWPAGRSIMKGRSACDGCGAPLGAIDLLPLASYALAAGRARCCGARIDPLHPLVELAGAAIGATALAVAPTFAGLAGALFGWTLLTLALLDGRHFWLPDRLTLPLLALGLCGGLAGLDPPLLDRMIGAATGYVLLEAVRIGYACVRHREGLGRGDAKLFAAIGVWLGWRALPLILLSASLIGLVLALTLFGRAPARTDRLPLGAFLCIAAWGQWVIAWHL